MGYKKPGSKADLAEKRARARAEAPETIGLSMSEKQIRARARRKATKHQRIAQSELETLYKPLEEWDMEELARGRPRASDGTFKGRPPAYISREVHEKAMERFRDMVRGEMQIHTVSALKLLGNIIDNDEADDRGKPLVNASTKLEAVKFLLEHVVGKPKQPVEADISVKLQGILGAALVTPGDASAFAAFQPASPSAARALGRSEEILDAEGEEDEDEE